MNGIYLCALHKCNLVLNSFSKRAINLPWEFHAFFFAIISAADSRQVPVLVSFRFLQSFFFFLSQDLSSKVQGKDKVCKKIYLWFSRCFKNPHFMKNYASPRKREANVQSKATLEKFKHFVFEKVLLALFSRLVVRLNYVVISLHLLASCSVFVREKLC